MALTVKNSDSPEGSPQNFADLPASHQPRLAAYIRSLTTDEQAAFFAHHDIPATQRREIDRRVIEGISVDFELIEDHEKLSPNRHLQHVGSNRFAHVKILSSAPQLTEYGQIYFIRFGSPDDLSCSLRS